MGSGALLIANSTFFDNRAGGPGDDDGIGGAVYGGSDTVDILHTTFDSNQASEEGTPSSQTTAPSASSAG